jgi:hypothetical protein
MLPNARASAPLADARNGTMNALSKASNLGPHHSLLGVQRAAPVPLLARLLEPIRAQLPLSQAAARNDRSQHQLPQHARPPAAILGPPSTPIARRPPQLRWPCRIPSGGLAPIPRPAEWLVRHLSAGPTRDVAASARRAGDAAAVPVLQQNIEDKELHKEASESYLSVRSWPAPSPQRCLVWGAAASQPAQATGQTVAAQGSTPARQRPSTRPAPQLCDPPHQPGSPAA